MSAAAKRQISPKEYLAAEHQAAFRSEYFNGEVFAMAGARYEHVRVNDILVILAGKQLEGGPCYSLSRGMRVKVDATGLYCYPDVVFLCEEPRFDDDHFDTLLNPRVIVEVLSESTEKVDRGVKFGHYRQLPSLQEYVLVTPDQILVERYVRQPDKTWSLTVLEGADQILEFSSLPVRIPLAELYRGVKLRSVCPPSLRGSMPGTSCLSR